MYDRLHVHYVMGIIEKIMENDILYPMLSMKLGNHDKGRDLTVLECCRTVSNRSDETDLVLCRVRACVSSGLPVLSGVRWCHSSTRQ